MNVVSVIVTAHDRKKYILDALRSIIVSDLPRDKLEIIIVKNYKDSYIDDEIDKLSKQFNIISLIENNFKLGAKISVGIKNSSGDIITFLEDDDLYSPSRLQILTKVFSEMKNVVFYHNMFEIMGDKKIEEIVTDYQHDMILSCDNDKRRNWRKLTRTEAKFNLSSMALRGEVIRSWIDIISKVNFAVDNLLFYIGLSERGCIMIDPEVLTKYRVSSKREYLDDQSKLLQFKQFIAEKYFEDFILLNTIFENSYFIDSIKQGVIFWYLENKILSENHNNFGLNTKSFLNIIVKNKVLLSMFLLSLLPYRIRKFFIYKYFVK